MRKLFLGTAILFAALVGIVALSKSFFSVSAQDGFKAHSLLTATVSEVQQAALDFAASDSRVLAPPQILLTRSITKKELPELGLSEIGYGDHDPPLALVVLEGKFEIQPRGLTTAGPDQVKYIFYVLDLYVGAPTYTEYSRDGTGYAKFLAYVKSATTAPGDQLIDPNAKYFDPGRIQTAVPAFPTSGPSAIWCSTPKTS